MIQVEVFWVVTSSWRKFHVCESLCDVDVCFLFLGHQVLSIYVFCFKFYLFCGHLPKASKETNASKLWQPKLYLQRNSYRWIMKLVWLPCFLSCFRNSKKYDHTVLCHFSNKQFLWKKLNIGWRIIHLTFIILVCLSYSFSLKDAQVTFSWTLNFLSGIELV